MRTVNIQGTQTIRLCKIVLGTNYFGAEIPEERAMELMDEYYRLGGRTIDTARMYGQSQTEGVSLTERTVGRWLRSRGCRDEITLITKGGHPPMEDMKRHRLDADSLRRDFSDSLKCLDCQYVDVYMLHRDDKEVPVQGIMDTLHEFVRGGQARVLGASNWRLERILEANAYARENGKTPFAVSEIQWSLALCDQESWGDDTLVLMDNAEHAGYLEAGIPVLAFSSQAKGLFSKYLSGGEAALTKKTQRFLRPENIRRARRVGEVSGKTGLSPAAVCLGYITANPLEGCAIVGCTSVEQLQDSMTAADVCFDRETLRFLEGE